MKVKGTIYLEKSNLIFLVYALLLLFCCSPFSDYQVYRQVQSVMPYLNLIYVGLGIFTIFKKNSFKYALLFSSLLLLLFIISAMNGSSIGSICAFLTLLLGVYFCSSINYTEDFIRIIALIGIIYNMLALLKCAIYYSSWFGNENSINPNTICVLVLLFSFIITMFWENFFSYNHSLKFILCIHYVLSGFNLFMYRSRTCLMAFLFFLFLKYIFKNKIWKNNKFIIIFTLLIIIGGILFPIFYISAPKFIINIIESVTHKAFYSGRNIIWGKFFAALSDTKNLLIGPGSISQSSYTMLGTKEVSMHNSYLGIMLNFGIVGFVITAVILIFYTYKASMLGNSKVSMTLIIAIESILFMGYAEEILVDPYFVIFNSIIIGIAVQSNKGRLGSFLYENSNNDMV